MRLVSHENPEVCRNACGALRNLSYGRQNDENKRAIRDAGGIPALMALLCRATDMEVSYIENHMLSILLSDSYGADTHSGFCLLTPRNAIDQLVIF